MPTDFYVPHDLERPVRSQDAPRPGEIVPAHNPMCFGCGPDSQHGLHMVAVAGEDIEVSADLLIEPRFEGGPGVIHGGILSAAFDEIMGKVPWLIGAIAVTGHLEIDYLRPVPINNTVTLRARLLGVQRRKIFTEATATLLGETELLARSRGLFVSIDAAAHFRDTWQSSGFADDIRRGHRE